MNRGVYGPDDVPWEVQQMRDNSEDQRYRKHKEEIDAQERLSIKRDLLARHEPDGYIFQNSDNQLYIGFERNGSIYTFAILNLEAAAIHFTPLAKESRYLVRWTPLSQIRVRDFKMVAPKGCI